MDSLLINFTRQIQNQNSESQFKRLTISVAGPVHPIKLPCAKIFRSKTMRSNISKVNNYLKEFAQTHDEN